MVRETFLNFNEIQFQKCEDLQINQSYAYANTEMCMIVVHM